jgi:hypothetical protein
MLQYGKLYQSLKRVSAEWHGGTVLWEYCWFYLKVFEGGTFLYAPYKSEDFDKINFGMNPLTSKFISKGIFLLNENKIELKFENSSMIGVVQKDGKILLEGKAFWDIFSLVP